MSDLSSPSPVEAETVCDALLNVIGGYQDRCREPRLLGDWCCERHQLPNRRLPQ